MSLSLTGRELEPLVAALGVVGLAGVVGLLATRRRGRVAVGAVLAVAGVAVLLRSLGRLTVPGAEEVRRLLADSGRSGGVPPAAAVTAVARPGWALLAAAGGLVLAVGGLGVVLRSRRWPTLSSRYERPTRPTSSAPARDRAAPAAPAGDPAPAGGRPPMSDTALWDAIDSGRDPTAEDRSERRPRPRSGPP